MEATVENDDKLPVGNIAPRITTIEKPDKVEAIKSIRTRFQI